VSLRLQAARTYTLAVNYKYPENYDIRRLPDPGVVRSSYLKISYCVSTRNTDRLMLFGKIIVVYYESHIKPINTLCIKNVEFFNVKAGDIFTNSYALNV
jgi:hypothetical protein